MLMPVRARRPRRGEVAAIATLVTPALLGLVAFVAVPFLLAVGWLSTHRVNLANPDQPKKFMGLSYYQRLLDPGVPGSLADKFYGALLNNVTFAVVVVVVQTGLAVLLAVAVNRPSRFTTFFRGLFFLPVVFPMALVAVVWQLIYSPDQRGLLNAALGAVSGGHVGPQDWLGNPHLAMMSIIVLSIWQGVGFQMVIILAGLQNVPRELYEAASIDRAGAWSQFRHVTLPGLRNTLVFVVLMTTLLALRLFDQVQILTPNNDATRTVMSLDIEQRQNVGQAAAISVVFFVLALAVMLVQRLVIREEREIR
jgi:multiple sugar transport system permease protein